MFRKCAKCKTEKTKEEFYKNKSEPLGISYTCKPCALQYNKNWRKNNTERASEITQNWKDRNPQKVYTGKLRREYNITFEQFEILLQKQNYLCSICYVKIEKPYVAKKIEVEPAYVDHCHKTMKIRGLLCQHCNTAIGFFRDNIKIMENAIKYLNNQSGSNNV